MKKKLSIILAALMLAAALTGCSGSGSSSKQEKSDVSTASQSSITEGSKTEESSKQASAEDSTSKQESAQSSSQTSKQQSGQTSAQTSKQESGQTSAQASKQASKPESSQSSAPEETSTIEIVLDPESSGDVIVLDPEASDAIIVEESDNKDSSPFMELSYNRFEISGSGIGSTKLPAYYILKTPQQTSEFISKFKNIYSFDNAYIGSENNKRSFSDYSTTFNDDFFAGEDLMILVAAVSASSESDLGDIITDDSGNVNVDIWGEEPKSDSDKMYVCFAISYAKDALDGKQITVSLSDLAEGEE